MCKENEDTTDLALLHCSVSRQLCAMVYIHLNSVGHAEKCGCVIGFLERKVIDIIMYRHRMHSLYVLCGAFSEKEALIAFQGVRNQSLR